MQTVKHKMFGIGEVISKEIRENDIYLTVCFSSGEEKRFATKSFMDGFVAAEGDLKDEIEKIVANKKTIEAKKRADFMAPITANTATNAGTQHRTSTKTVVKNSIATAFEAYLIKEGYSTETPSGHPSTVYSYIDGIERNVLDEEHISWDGLKNNIDTIVKQYDIGGSKESIGSKSNCTVINALKRFSEFVNP